MPEVAAVFIVMLQISAMGYSRALPPDDAKFQAAFVNESDCRKLIPAVRRAVRLPAGATLDGVFCKGLELRK